MHDVKELKPRARTLVIHPELRHGKFQKTGRPPEMMLEEAKGLAEAIWLELIDSDIVHVREVISATFLGKGKCEELSARIKDQQIDLVIFNAKLTPTQQRNMEKALGAKVIDRTALILEIFGARAATREGILQVELAALDYQKSRLVRSWTHLERQRGGFGFLGGPGESQIESDRRQIRDRISKIKRELETVKTTRTLHRQSRQEEPYPVVALVGYTNAGKSTLFNRLTGANVFAEDLLFATLDPTMRALKLKSGRKIILSDTVGFISDLPTELIAAFRATLEEVVAAEVILHVRDISAVDADEQKDDVLKVLKTLGLQEVLEERLIEVWNKTDILGHDVSPPASIAAISALNGDGCKELLDTVDALLAKQHQVFKVKLHVSDGKLLAWLYQHGENIVQKPKGEWIHVSATLSPKNIARFEHLRKT